MTNATSTLNRVLCAAGLALFLAAPIGLAQFSVTWDFGLGTNTTSDAHAQYGTAVVNSVNGSLGSAAYFTTPLTTGAISWSNPFSTGSPEGVDAVNPTAAQDAWIFKGMSGGGTTNSWLQAPAAGTPLIGGTSTAPTWGDGTLGSASYLAIDLPDFTAYSGDPLVLESVTVEAGSHGQNTTAGPEVYGIYQLGGGLLGSVWWDWGSDPLPLPQLGGTIADPWEWNVDSPGVVDIDTGDTPIAQSDSFDLLFFAGYVYDPGSGTGPMVLDNLTLNFALAAAPGNGGGYGAPNGASGTPEPAGALLGLLSLGMVSFRRKRRS